MLARNRWEGIDAVVNNAATPGPVGSLVEVAMDEWVQAATGN